MGVPKVQISTWFNQFLRKMAESNINGKVKGSPLFSKQLRENMNNVYDVMIPTYLFSESWMSKFASDSINLSTISLWSYEIATWRGDLQ